MQAAVVLAPSRRRFVLTALPLALAVWGQWALFTQKLILDGAVLFSVAAVPFFVLVLRHERLVRAPEAPGDSADATPLRWASLRAPLLAMVACVALAWAFSGGDRLRPETVVFWFLGTALYIKCFWQGSLSPRPGVVQRLCSLPSHSPTLSWSALGVAAVLLVAAFFRYYQIGSIPAEMTSDHAEKLLDIQDVLNGKFSIFFPRNTGREPLQFYVEVPFVLWLGLGHLALKAFTATVSLATVLVLYFIGKEIAGKRFGLLAALFLAVSKWDVGIGRMGLRFPLYPFFAALAFLFLLRALRRGRRNDYLLCGLFTGIGLYGYTPFRIMLLLIAATVLLKLAFEAKRGWATARATLFDASLSAGAVAVVLIPLAHYMAENPEMFWSRTLSRVTSTEAPVGAHSLSVLLGNLVNGLLMFNWRGDEVWITTVPLDPALDYVSGGLFALGVVWCLYSLIRHREREAAYLLAALLVFMLPSVTSIAFPRENPSFSRAGADTWVAALLVAAPVYLTGRRLLETWPDGTGRIATLAMAVVLLGLAARANYDRYFIDFAPQYRQSARNSSEMARVIDSFAQSIGSRQNAFLKDWPHWVDTRNIAFNVGYPDWSPGNIIYNPDDLRRQNPPPGNLLYLVNKDDKEAVSILQQKFPEGQLKQQPSAVPGQEFLTFFVPRKQ